MDSPVIYICAPTFREPEAVVSFVRSIESLLKPAQVHLVIVNANPGDQTSTFLNGYSGSLRLTEIHGVADEFWTATVNRAFSFVLEKAEAENSLLWLCNIDIVPDEESLEELLSYYSSLGPNVHLSSLGYYQGKFIYSGFNYKSWFLGLSHHPFSGIQVSGSNIPDIPVPVDMVPGRNVLIPVKALQRVGLMNSEIFPHYNADLVLSHLLSSAGYQGYICPKAKFFSDRSNTGLSVYSAKYTFRQRLSNFMSKKNPSHPKFRYLFIKEVFPWYALPSALLIYMIKSLVEVLFGGSVIRRLFGVVGRGY